MELGPKGFIKNFEKEFISVFENFPLPITSWWPFSTFSMSHSHHLIHGRNFASIFVKIADETESCLLLFAIENQLNWLITSANMADCV